MTTRLEKTLKLLSKLQVIERQKALKAQELYRSREVAAISKKQSISDYKDSVTLFAKEPEQAWSTLNKINLRSRLTQAIDRQDVEIGLISEQRRMWADEAVSARRQQNALDTLIAKKQHEQAVAESKKDQKMMDEMASLVSGRSNA